MKKFTLLLVLCMMGMMAFAQGYYDNLKSKAEQGDAKAQYDLYYYYAKRNFEESDINMAVSYLLMAAENEYPEALYKLGCCYKTGDLGLPVWKEKAKDCFFRASELGHDFAKMELIVLTMDYKPYRKGIRKSVYKQTISVAPQSQTTSYKSNRSKFIGQ